MKTITSYFFSDLSIDAIALPDTVETLEDNAFYNCENLEGISLGSGLRSIDPEAFDACNSLLLVSLHAQCPLKIREIVDLFPEDCEIERFDE